MANPEHLAILKQGVEAWNKWRGENPEVHPDLKGADLSAYKLSWINFSGADLSFADFTSKNLPGTHLGGINFRKACLKGAKLLDAYLAEAIFTESDLTQAELSFSDLSVARFENATLCKTKLTKALLFRTNFEGAYLTQANLDYAFLVNTKLGDADLSEAHVGNTVFAHLDLGKAKRLHTVVHKEPSFISIDTIYRSRGKIPEAFLRGCGLSDWEIESVKLYNPDLSNEEINDTLYLIHDLRARRAFQINPLFISYSHADGAFVDAIEKRLVEQGIRFWRDVHHAKAGRLEKQIDQAIHLNDIVLLVLSEHSTQSDWVEHEARKAREKEKQTGKDALCPVALDDSWKTCRWPERLREQIREYNILDFSKWQESGEFERMFSRLVDGLAIFYK